MTSMRLRLRIERNGLPPTQVLWPVKDPNTTVARLLHTINDTFPLEADTWGLEDYSVSGGGYEYLHYHELGSVCKDEDEVLIRPLQYVDVRARTLTGRTQIAIDGRHMIDGVPFGRPCLKEPVRPQIRIPARKRRKLEHDVEDQEVLPLMLTESGELEDDVDDEDEDEDEDYNVEEEEDGHEEEEEEEEEEESIDSSESDILSSRGISDADELSSSSDDTSDTSTSDDSESDSDDSVSDQSWNGFETSDHSVPARKDEATVSQVTSNISLESPSHTTPGNDRASEDTEPRTVHVGIPHEGKDSTKARNARRRDVKKLRKLIESDDLPQDATLETLRAWEATPGMYDGSSQREDFSREHREVEVNSKTVDDEKPKAKQSKREKRAAMTNGGATLPDSQHRPEDFERQREKLLQALSSGGVDVSAAGFEDENELPQEFSSKKVSLNATAVGSATGFAPGTHSTPAFVPPSVARRSRLDLASSQRLLFGSLGVRVPKTEEEREKLQKKLAAKPNQKMLNKHLGVDTAAVVQPATGKSEAKEVEPPEAWRSKINLTAVECCELDVVALSTPPFPFKQRWDPQQQRKPGGKRTANGDLNNAGKKRKRARHEAYNFTETYDKYNTDGYGDALDYDDVEQDYWANSDMLDENHEEDTDGAAADAVNAKYDDGFPELPANLDDLQILDKDNAHVGDFITYVELACDSATGWEPKMVTRLAKIIRAAEGGNDDWVLQLSSNDVEHREYDAEGNRVYAKFEMPLDEGEEDQYQGEKTVRWEELGDAKLVLRGNEEKTD